MNIRDKFHEIEKSHFRRHVNELTHKPTNKHDRSQYLLADLLAVPLCKLK